MEITVLASGYEIEALLRPMFSRQYNILRSMNTKSRRNR